VEIDAARHRKALHNAAARARYEEGGGFRLKGCLVSEREKLDQFIRERVLEESLNDLRLAFFESLTETFERFPEAEWSFAIVRKAIHEMMSCEILRPLVAKLMQMSENTMRAEPIRIFVRQRQMANKAKRIIIIEDQRSPQFLLDSRLISRCPSSKSRPSNRRDSK
jgi:hypothetical protein